MKKASHLSRSLCVKGTLRNIKNVVGKFLFCTDGHNGGFKMCLSYSMATRLGLKVHENHLKWQQIAIRIIHTTHNDVSDLKTCI